MINFVKRIGMGADGRPVTVEISPLTYFQRGDGQWMEYNTVTRKERPVNIPSGY